MGILDDIAGQTLGSGGAKNNLLGEVMGLLGNQQTNGLTGLIQQFAGKGLGDIVNSWVGTGQNLPISPQQIQHGLGSDVIGTLASKAGLSTSQVASHLSELLPQVVDKLTPNGRISQEDIVSKGMNLLKDLMR